MKCKYLTIRSKNNKKYKFCRLDNIKIDSNQCYNCNKKEYKNVKPISKKTNKLQSLENSRYSIIQEDITKCYICNKELKLDRHEAIGGMNRLTSIKWGLVLYLCRKCHSDLDINQNKKEELQILAQNKFEEKYGIEKFMNEFKMNYKEKKVKI